MTPFSTLADACNPQLPGCQPEEHTLVPIGLLLVALALLLVVAGVIVLVVILIMRGGRGRKVASRGASEAPGVGAGGKARAGWFPDPIQESQWRWWDGSDWTDTVSDGGSPQIDPGDTRR